VLPSTGLPQARAIIERLLARVRKARPLACAPERAYSCSVGLTQVIWGEAATVALQRADLALYQAKASGRDRLVVADAAASSD
jgi:PleD family two-component response regulator